MFYIYWILMMIALITSFAYLSIAIQNKNHVLLATSLIQCLTSVLLPFLNFMFVTSGNWKNSFENEFVFLWQKIHEGNMIAFLILLGYLIMFALVVMNGKWVTERKNDHSITL